MKASVFKFNPLVLTFLAISLYAQGEVKLPASSFRTDDWEP